VCQHTHSDAVTVAISLNLVWLLPGVACWRGRLPVCGAPAITSVYCQRRIIRVALSIMVTCAVVLLLPPGNYIPLHCRRLASWASSGAAAPYQTGTELVIRLQSTSQHRLLPVAPLSGGHPASPLNHPLPLPLANGTARLTLFRRRRTRTSLTRARHGMALSCCDL